MDDRRYDESMDLSGIGELLPYHSAVNAGTVLGGLNRMIDDVAAGRPVFYDIYSETDRRDDQSKKNTGLFFFRGRPAGARMAASIGLHGVSAFGGDDLPKPAAVIMAYTAHTDHSDDEPPTYVVVGSQDGIAPPSSMELSVAELNRLGTQVEYRRFATVGHGFEEMIRFSFLKCQIHNF